MSKQTSVEWLQAEINKRGPTENNPPKWLQELYDQAKEMEREQIEAAYRQGYRDAYDNSKNMFAKYNSDKDYYTQTYGKKFLDLVSPETSQVHEVVGKLKEKKATNKQVLDAYGQSYKMMQEAKRNDDNRAKLKEGDIIEISGFYFTWEVKYGYSNVLKSEGLHAVAQGGLIHSNLVNELILTINGKKVK